MKLDAHFDKLEAMLLYGHSPSELLKVFRELKRAVYAVRHIDPVLGCVITEPPPAKPGQGERYHG